MRALPGRGGRTGGPYRPTDLQRPGTRPASERPAPGAAIPLVHRQRRCTLQRYSAPGRTPQFTYAETRPGHTDLVFAESYRTGASARVVLESAGLFDILADAGMLVLHSAYIVTRQGEGILFSGPSGIGKSTQAALWQRYGAAQTVNGDRALVRPDTGTVSGVMYAGTSGICRNVTAPLPGGGAAASGPGEPGDGYPAPGGLCPGAEPVRLSPVGPRLRRADDGAGGPAGYQRTRSGSWTAGRMRAPSGRWKKH